VVATTSSVRNQPFLCPSATSRRRRGLRPLSATSPTRARQPNRYGDELDELADALAPDEP